MRVKGAGKFAKDMTKMAKKEVIKKVVELGTRSMYNYAAGITPVDTGLSMNTRGYTDSGTKGEFGYTTDYIIFPENGTRYQRAQYFLRRNYERQGPKSKKDAINEVRKLR